MQLSETKTFEFLKKIFELESQQAMLYMYYAKIAGFEGYSDTEKLFKDFSELSVCNAHGNLDFIKYATDPLSGFPMGETEKNLQSTIAIESDAYSQFYSMVIQTARDEGLYDIANWIDTLFQLKKTRFKKLKTLTEKTGQ